MGLAQFLTNRRMLKLVLGTAGTWFLFDYAYYGNTLSLPSILKERLPPRQPGDQAGVDAGPLRGLRPARLSPGRGQDGPHRPPPPAADRLRRHGRLLRRSSAPCPPSPHRSGRSSPSSG